MYSVQYAAVRTGVYETWAEARDALTASLTDRMPRFPFPDTDRARYRGVLESHVAELSATPDVANSERQCVWFSQWDGITYRDGSEVTGLAAGDLAIVHDYSNGNRDGWTIDVKCKVKSVHPKGVGYGTPTVTIRVTGESFQFDRYMSLMVPASFLLTRPRNFR